MSNGRPLLVALGVALGCRSAFAQTQALLDAVRVHRAGAAQQARDELGACSAAKCEGAATLSLLAGYLTLSDGDARAAAEQLASTPPPPGLEAVHAWYLGEALAWSGQEAKALEAWKPIGPSSPSWLLNRAVVRRGEVLLKLGRAKLALPILEAAAAKSPTPELLYQRGLARALTGGKEKAWADLRALLLRFPAHPHAAAAQAILEARGPLSLSTDERLQRGRALLEAGQPKRARDEVAGLAGAQAAFLLAQAAFALGEEPQARAQLELATSGGPGVASEAMALAAKKLLRAGDHAGAQQALRALDLKYPTLPAADEAGYLAAWISLQDEAFDEAVAAFRAFEERHPTSRRRDEARWFSGYALYRAGKYEQAQATLVTLGEDFPRSALVPQARYWSARCAEAARPAGAAVEPIAQRYREVLASHAGTLYAQLARERLLGLGEKPPPLFARQPQLAPAAALPELKLARALAAAGLFRDAQDEVQLRVTAVQEPARALALGKALQAQGEYWAAHQLAARLLWGQTYGARNPEAIALMYPRAYQEAVGRWCSERSVEPWLVWAVMRRESAFRPDVSSAADARGLMQIIPPTARAIARELKEAEPDADALFAPELNLSQATWYLNALGDRFAHVALVAGAYNAGPGAVLRWLEARGSRPLDEFIEEIAYKETRGYVRQVTADYFVYRALYGEPDEKAERLSLTLPTPRAAGVAF